MSFFKSRPWPPATLGREWSRPIPPPGKRQPPCRRASGWPISFFRDARGKAISKVGSWVDTFSFLSRIKAADADIRCTACKAACHNPQTTLFKYTANPQDELYKTTVLFASVYFHVRLAQHLMRHTTQKQEGGPFAGKGRLLAALHGDLRTARRAKVPGLLSTRQPGR